MEEDMKTVLIIAVGGGVGAMLGVGAWILANYLTYLILR